MTADSYSITELWLLENPTNMNNSLFLDSVYTENDEKLFAPEKQYIPMSGANEDETLKSCRKYKNNICGIPQRSIKVLNKVKQHALV